MSNLPELQESLKKLNLPQLQQQIAAMKTDIFNKFSDVANVLQNIKNMETSPVSSCATSITSQPAHPLMYNTMPETDKSNVVFVPAQKSEDTKVFVGDVEIASVVRAKLDYNPELGFPVLHLEIVNPVIGVS